jgi:hypothetical protein
MAACGIASWHYGRASNEDGFHGPAGRWVRSSAVRRDGEPGQRRATMASSVSLLPGISYA